MFRFLGIRRAVLGASVAALLLVPAASSAAVTVTLRVEGANSTLFEGPVAAQPETFETGSSAGPHPCDYSQNGSSESEFPNGGTPSATPTNALRAAALTSGLAFDAEWFGNAKSPEHLPGDFFVTQVGPDKNETSPPFASWGYAVNETTAAVGGCQIALAPGNEVLWAYNYFNLSHRLKLSGPASAEPGRPFAVHVVDAQTGAAMAGAAVGTLAGGVTTPAAGAPTTDAEGNVAVTLPSTGMVALKATRAESVRSNAIVVCVHAGNDGACGTTVPPPPLQRGFEGDVPLIRGLTNHGIYARRNAPRILAGVVDLRAGGTLGDVRISLQRTFRHRCFNFSGVRVRFVRTHRCGHASFFSVGGSQSFSYLLPARLPAGRFVFSMEAVEANGRITAPVAGVSRVSFRVK
jgi:hypothetical protein